MPVNEVNRITASITMQIDGASIENRCGSFLTASYITECKKSKKALLCCGAPSLF